MWQRISIRWQLIALVTVAMVLVEISLLGMDYYNDIQQRRLIAIEQAETLSNALQHDLVRAVIEPKADSYSDISFRVSSFEPVRMMVVFDNEGRETFRYLHRDFSPGKDINTRTGDQPLFIGDHLHIRRPMHVDGYRFGDIFFLLDLTRYRTGLQQQLFHKLVIFLFQLGIALPIAWLIGRNFTRPFLALATAMKNADVARLQFPTLHSDAANEIGTLFQGYNELTAQVGHAAEELKYLSEHDSLTGLLNRYAMEQLITQTLRDESVTSNVLILLDIDQFKLVNDGAGHSGGDELLRQLGHLLSGQVDGQVKLARVGGDDFVFLIPGASEPDGVLWVEKLLLIFRDFRFNWDNKLFDISACAGVLAFKPCEFTLQSLGLALDSAFYSAKAKGNGQYHVYRPDDEQVRQYSADIKSVAVIKDALQQGQARFELWAQTIAPLQHETEQISYEILLRLKDADGKPIYPDRFLPVANRYQLMVDIDIYVLRHYLLTVTAYPGHLDQLAFVNINLGGATLNQPRFQQALRQAIQEFDFPWEKLVLEVTETSGVGNLAQAGDFIDECRQRGIRVALDDFGTGMASFEYLKHLPLDVVKIDGSFVRDMLDDPIDHAMVSYVNEISKLRNQETIAEFVELEQHVTQLRDIGIDYGQGYHLGKPQPLQQWLD